jgi:hypothetical protein
MRIPAPILEHPVETAIAGLLLMALLFVSAGPQPQTGAHSPVNQSRSARM